MSEGKGKENSVKMMSLDEFRDFGYLQEVNIRFFHPLGLALAIVIDHETGKVKSLGGLQDCRHDPAGMAYRMVEVDLEKQTRFLEEWLKRTKTRVAELGFVFQPLDESGIIPELEREEIRETVAKMEKRASEEGGSTK